MDNNEQKDYLDNNESEIDKENTNLEENLTEEINNPEENNNGEVNFTIQKDETLPEKTVEDVVVNNEDDSEEKGLTIINEKKRKNRPYVLVIAICFLALTSFFASREFINHNKNTTTINKVENILGVKVETKGVKRGEVMNAKEIYANNVDSVVGIQTEIDNNLFGQVITGEASGTGFVISKDGYILTNHHVIENANKIKVNLYNEKEYVATLIGTEEELDIAVLKIDAKDLTPVNFGDSNNIIVGEDVYAIGHPLGQLTYTLTDGIVSAKNREIELDYFLSLNMFQTNAALNSGNSGGPIFNSYGEVIGIATAKYSRDDIEGIGFVIPINDVLNIVDQLVEFGRVTNKSYLGITVTSVADKDSPKGAYIADVVEGACAHKAGLKIGDIIVKVDATEIVTNNDVIKAKKKYKAGDTATFKVWRDGEYLDIEVIFDTYDEDAEASIKKFQEEQIKELQDRLKGLEKDVENPEG